MGVTKYHQLNDRAWLEQKYVEEGLSTHQIARLIEAKGHSVVVEALVRLGISARDKRSAVLRRFENDGRREDDGFILNMSVITGGLLGDAYLKNHSKTSSYGSPAFGVKHKDRQHVEFVSRLLFPSNPEGRIFERTYWYTRLGRQYTSYELLSLTHGELSPLFEEWYPEMSGYRKVVPASIKIDETSLLHWFMDDGTAVWNKRQVKICLSTMSFCRADQERLGDILARQWGLDVQLHRTPNGSGWTMAISQRHTVEFYEIIGLCPVPSLEYKWKTPNPLVRI